MGHRRPRAIQVARTYVLPKRKLRGSRLRHHTSRKSSYRATTLAHEVLTHTLQASLDKAKSWVKELQRQANENIIIALAGNKLDLVTDQPDKRAVPTADAEAYAREANLLFFETSAKTAENVKELFTAIAKKLPIEQASQRGMRGPAGRPGGVDLGRQETGNTAGGAGGCNC